MSFDTPEIGLAGFDIGFIEWLDDQCKGGWEICIHEIIEKKAQYSPTKEAHWCVFRKKIEDDFEVDSLVYKLKQKEEAQTH